MPRWDSLPARNYVFAGLRQANHGRELAVRPIMPDVLSIRVKPHALPMPRDCNHLPLPIVA